LAPDDVHAVKLAWNISKTVPVGVRKLVGTAVPLFSPVPAHTVITLYNGADVFGCHPLDEHSVRGQQPSRFGFDGLGHWPFTQLP
jgi:hypothetical protein